MNNDAEKNRTSTSDVKIDNDEHFIKQVEHLIDPAEVCDLYFFQRFKKYLPKTFFKRMLIKASKKSPYIGFIIEPYSLFLFFHLKDIEKAKSMLPKRYELIKARVLADEDPAYLMGMGIFNTKGSTFWGSRLESYLIARDKETDLVSWIFIDILSNTLIALPKEGVADRNCRQAVYTTNAKGDVFVDFLEDKTGRQLQLKGNIRRGQERYPEQPLWIGGNTSVAFSKAMADGQEDPFAVIFDPVEVSSALDIPLEDVDLRMNTLFPGLAEDALCKVICFPFAQHYIADSPGCRTYVKDEQAMVKAYKQIAQEKLAAPFSTGPIKRLFFSGIILSWLTSLVLLILLLLK